MVIISVHGRKRVLCLYKSCLSAALLVFFWIVLACTQVHCGVWDMDPPQVTGDPLWGQVTSLWADHYWGKNLDDLISVLNKLQKKDPDSIEPYLWLARVHHLHARYHSRERTYHYEKAEEYAAQACRMDPKNPLAVKALIDTLFHSKSRQYIMNKYSDLIRSCAPLPVGEALPDMKNIDGWDDFKEVWEARADIEKALEALSAVERMALDYASDPLVHTWASRVNYYIGEYYLSIDTYSKGKPYFKKGIIHAQNAVKLQPDSVTANFWMLNNITRSIQDDWLFWKSRYLMDLLTPTLFCARENCMYYFSGPMIALGVMISHGGWVTEKGMEMAGVNADMDMLSLELAEIVYPDYFFIPYQRAEILAYKGKKDEAIEILNKLVVRSPTVDSQVPENRLYLSFARRLIEDIQKGRIN